MKINGKLSTSICIGLLSFLLFIITRSGQHTYDGLMFSYAISRDIFPSTVFRPHNLLYLPSAIAFGKTLSLTGVNFNKTHPFLVGQIWSALWGSISVGIFYLITRRLLSLKKALGITILFITTFSVWAMATEVEVYTMSLATVSGLYLVLIRRHPSAILTGVLWGISILAHITNALLIIPLFFYYFMFGERKWRWFVIILITGIVLASGVYLAVGCLIAKVDSLTGFIAWIISWTAHQEGYGIYKVKQLLAGFLGLKRAFVCGRVRALMIFHIITLFSTFFIILKQRGLKRKIGLVFLSHIVVYSIFFSWWEPLNIEFWVVTMLPLCLMIGLAWRLIHKSKWRFAFSILIILTILVQLDFNLKAIIPRTDPTKDYWMNKAKSMDNHLRRNDLVIIFSDPIMFTLPLEAQHENTAVITILADAVHMDYNLAIKRLKKIIEITRKNGGKIFVTRDVLNPNPQHLAPFSITKEKHLKTMQNLVSSDLKRKIPGADLYY